MSEGITVCPVCRATLIVGEMKEHEHTDTCIIIGDILWVRWYDGKWYEHDLSPTDPNNQAPTTKKRTQPKYW